jgi:mannose-1-phosphate guanylyltransferase
MMKAMILGAGKGTRVQPITHDIPKPMIPLIRKPVMEYLINLLKQHGIEEIMVNTSHLAPVIESYFRDGEQFGVKIRMRVILRLELPLVSQLALRVG